MKYILYPIHFFLCLLVLPMVLLKPIILNPLDSLSRMLLILTSHIQD